jgi:hypothetical protein
MTNFNALFLVLFIIVILLVLGGYFLYTTKRELDAFVHRITPPKRIEVTSNMLFKGNYNEVKALLNNSAQEFQWLVTTKGVLVMYCSSLNDFIQSKMIIKWIVDRFNQPETLVIPRFCFTKYHGKNIEPPYTLARYLELERKASRDRLQLKLNIGDDKSMPVLRHAIDFIPGKSTFQHVLNILKPDIEHLEANGYNTLVISQFKVTIITSPSGNLPGQQMGLIAPLPKEINAHNENIGSLDTEAFLINNIFYVYAIGLHINNKYFRDRARIWTIENYLPPFVSLNDNIDTKILAEAGDQIIAACFSYIKNNFVKLTLFVHNLGGFDGVYFLRPLVLVYKDQFSLLHTRQGKLLSISTENFVIKDSLSFYDMKLADLGKVFNVPVQKGEFAHDLMTPNTFNSMKQEMIEYLNNDCVSLTQIMVSFNTKLFKDYHINLNANFIVSSSSLATAVWKTNFLHTVIELLPEWLETEIRTGYYGGAVQCFDHDPSVPLKHYDATSLYSTAMIQPMPIKYLGKSNFKGRNLYEFEGFIFAYVECPKNRFPILPRKNSSGLLEYPKEPFHGLFYHVELRQAHDLGYFVFPFYGYEFLCAYVLKEHNEHFFNLKTQIDKERKLLKSQGLSTAHLEGMRVSCKLMLNGLYGQFGRRGDLTYCSIVQTEKVNDFISQPEKDNSNRKLREMFDLKYGYTFLEFFQVKRIRSHVAIAAAVTSISRTVMNPHKINPGNPLVYTATDSVYLPFEIESKYVGNFLGGLKDELDGGWITEGYFGRPGCYAYKAFISNDPENEIEVVKIVGMKRKIVPFDEFKEAYLNGTKYNYTWNTWRVNFDQQFVHIVPLTRTLSILKSKQDETLSINQYES